MSRNGGPRLHGGDFSFVQGLDRQKFFTYVSFNEAPRFLGLIDEQERLSRFKALVAEIRTEHKIKSLQAMAKVMGKNADDFRKLQFHSAKSVPFGMTMDMCYLFQKDPARVFPELIWMRDLWLEDMKLVIASAQAFAAVGNLKGVTECLEALKLGVGVYTEPDTASKLTPLLQSTDAHFTQRYCSNQWIRKQMRNQLQTMPYQRAEQLDQQVAERLEHDRGEIYEILSAEEANTQAADRRRADRLRGGSKKS